jgi:hypothetical protein
MTTEPRSIGAAHAWIKSSRGSSGETPLRSVAAISSCLACSPGSAHQHLNAAAKRRLSARSVSPPTISCPAVSTRACTLAGSPAAPS